jgi:integrase
MVLKVTDAVPMFLDFMASRGLAPGTVKRHGVAARGFAAACQQVKGKNATMGQVDYRCIEQFFAGMNGEQGYRNNNLETLRRFLEWAQKRNLLRPGFTASALLEDYKVKKAQPQPKIYLAKAEFPAALEVAGNHHPRDRAAVALALYTLGRQSEFAPAKLSDLDLTRGEVRLYREKRDRWTVTGVTPELDAEMRQWLQAYAIEMGYMHWGTMVREHPDWLLIPSKRRGSGALQPTVQITCMERICKRVLTGLGVTTTRKGKTADHLGEGMHTFRRSGARAFFKMLKDEMGYQGALVRVGAMLDHDDLKNTLRYIGMDQEREELNDWLKGNSMYGTPEPPPAAAVIPLRRFA